MKIGEYEQMMAYLTRPGFNGGGSGKKPITIKELKDSGQITTASQIDRPEKAKLLEAIRKFEIKHGFRKKNNQGGPQIVEPPKSMQMDTTTSNPIPDYDINDFRNDAELFILAYHNNSLPRADIADKLNAFAQKGVDAGTFSMQDAGVMVQRLLGEVKDRAQKQRLRDVVPEGIGTVERDNKAIGGGAFVGEQLPNNREGFKLIGYANTIKGPLPTGPHEDEYSIQVRDDKTNKKSTKYFKDETKVNKFLETNSPKTLPSADDLRVISNKLKKKLGTLPTQTQIAKEAGITVTSVKARLKEGIDYAKPLSKSEAGKLGGAAHAELTTKDLIKPDDKKGLAELQKKVDALNEKYDLSDKGVSFEIDKTTSGNFGTKIKYNAGIYKDTLGKTRDTGSLEELEKIMKKFTKTELFKNYSKSEMFSVGGIKSAINQLRQNGSKQDLIFDYVLNSEQTPTIKELSKKFKMSEDLVTQDIKRLYTNIYRRKAGEGAPYLPGDDKKLSNVIEKVTNMDVKLTQDSVLNLITDAYGDSEKGDALRSKVRKFYTLQNKIPKKYQKYFSSQLDHIIPLNFLTQIRSGIPAEDLIRINPLPGFLNQRAFKSQLDTAIGTAKRTSNTKEGKEALKAYSELQTFLPEVLGGISKTGKITDFGVETLTEDRSLSKAQQTQTKKIYDSVLKFIDNPKAKPLLEKLGINPETAFNALRGSSQLIKKNIPGFLNTFKKILKENPDLRVELGDPYKEIENQYASLLTMSDATPAREEAKDSFPYEAALPAGVLFGKYAAPLAKEAIRLGSAPVTSAGLAISEALSDDPSLTVMGADLLYPEVIRQVKGKLSPIKNIYDKTLALSPSLRYAPYITKGMSGLGGLLIGADIYQGLAKRIGPDKRGPLTEQELLDMREKETYMGDIADAFDKAYKTRTGFADGPEDPSKRKFMKIVGGLATLPIVGRFFRIGEKAAPLVEKITTPNPVGKPEWFDALINKVIQEGTDMTKQFATKEREIVHGTKISDDEYVRVVQDLDDNSVRIEYDSPTNVGQDTVVLEVKPGMMDEATGKKPRDEFVAAETEPRYVGGPEDTDIEFDGENSGPGLMFIESDVSNLKQFATGKKLTKEEAAKAEKRKEFVAKINDDSYEAAQHLAGKYGDGPDPDYDDFIDE
jgi:hypothetical protein